MQEVVGRPGGPRPCPDAHDAGRCDRSLQPVVLEPVVEEVADRHGEDPDQVVDVPLGRPAPRAASRSSAATSSGWREPERRRLPQEHRSQELGGTLEQVLESGVDLAVLGRVDGDRCGCLLRLVEEEDRTVGRHRSVGRIQRDRPIAELVQAQIGDDLRLEHRDDVRGPRDPGSRPDLLGHACAAKYRAPLQDDDIQSGAGEIGGRGETVVPPADDDRVVARWRRPRDRRCAWSGSTGRRLDGGTLTEC